ncbi:unnamed protein product, partial [Oppiella nova]
MDECCGEPEVYVMSEVEESVENQHKDTQEEEGLEDRNRLETIEEPIDRQEMQTLDEVIDGSDIGVEGSAVVLEAQEGGCGVRDGRIETPELEEEDDTEEEGSGYCEPIASTIGSGAQNAVNERPFVCVYPDCGKRFTHKTNLNRHKRLHSGKKPFKCDEKDCGKCFLYKYYLNGHKSIVHSKEKRFHCDYKGCDQKFAYKMGLIRHKRVHSGEKPFACYVMDCDKRFTRKSDVNKHKKVVHLKLKPFVCNEDNCGQKLAVKSSLVKHNRIHTGEKPYVCDHKDCGKIPELKVEVSIMAKVVTNLLAIFYGIIKNRSTYFHTKRRDVPPKCLKDPALGTHHFIQLKDIKMHFVSKGDENKQLMLFIHGFPEFWYSWRHQMKEFAKDYHVIAVDNRGYGDTDKPTGAQNYTIDQIVEDTRQLVE